LIALSCTTIVLMPLLRRDASNLRQQTTFSEARDAHARMIGLLNSNELYRASDSDAQMPSRSQLSS
jgi:hypothetical protein